MTHEDRVLNILREVHPNILIVGSDNFTDEFLDRLRPCLSQPLHTCDLPGLLALPAPDGGTLLLCHVAELAIEQQDQLLQWLDGNGGHVQVVSVSSIPLFSRVEGGTFDRRLYYRLNTVLEEIEPSEMSTTLQ